MSTRRPVAIAVSMVCLLQACASPSAPVAPKAMQVEPVLRLNHAGAQSASTYYKLGKFHQERGNLDAARTAYLQSIALDARQADARNALAVIDAKQGRLEDAARLLEALVRDYPQDAYLQNNLAYVQYLRHDYSAALSALEHALTIEPGSARAHANLDLVQAALIEKKQSLVAGHTGAPAPQADAAHEDKAKTDTTPPATAPRQDADIEMAVTTAREALPKPAPAELRRKASALALQVAPAAPAVAPAPAPTPVAAAYVQPEQSLRVVQLQANIIELRPRSAPAKAARELPVTTDTHAPQVSHAAVREEIILATTAAPVKPHEIETRQQPKQEAKTFRVDIANGNGIEGMAARMRTALEQRGIAVGHLSNKKPYDTTLTAIQYRAGYLQEAERVRRALQAPVALAAMKDMPANADVRLLLGKDAGGHLALLSGSSKLALNDSRR
ncbi:LytR C-terminal domain-containing protein [Noviherbaspirillum pedocola]|uniref:LytR C-terminal domain-containing protein n=1 Tax=Noviherbaspirillum pedocola TaxID=2801341 RepID=A0A934SY08_9BURK|nr:LytR C-terminal domain-containing protein [Noviherbaspirillum pedocola]MBK4733823.1 LytR C-terminal domain-containing protein [Noviherbaspirillum pedocola]